MHCNFLKQLQTVVFNQIDKRKYLHLLGTISRGGLIHILCSSEYLGQQDVDAGLSKNKRQCVFTVLK